MSRWKHKTRFYYREETPYHQKGDLAIEVVHADDRTRDIEIEIGKNRLDIGLIETIDLETGKLTVIQEEHKDA